MTYHFVAENIGVDSGIILLSDIDFYGKGHKPLGKRYQKVFKVKLGKYKLFWKIDDTMMGDVSENGIINITSGKLVVSDPCYIIPTEDKWYELLETTKYFKNPPEGTVVLDQMGGDGIYRVEIVLEKI